MRRTAALAACVALFVAGCGSEEEGDPIPRQIASAIESQLDAIESRIDAQNPGACADIGKDDDSGTIAEIERQIAALPAGVDEDARDTLADGVDRLQQLVQEECSALEQETETTETEEVPLETDTVETVPTVTEEQEEEQPTVDEDQEVLPPGQQKKEDEGRQEGGQEPPVDGPGGTPAPGGDEE